MKKIVLSLVGLFIVTGAAGLFLYEWVLGETEEASGPISAAEISEANLGVRASGDSEPLTLEIFQDASEARFIIYEELRGEPVDVIGVTNQVAGQFRFDLQDLSRAELGVIQVNARTFVTDEERRDRATRNRILHTDEFEFITFTPTRLEGLSGAAQVGDTLEFTAHGDLVIRDVTHPAAFSIVMEIASPETVIGEATTSISREDYQLNVPNLRFLANVGDEVKLEFTGEFRVAEPEGNLLGAESTL